VEGRLGFSDLWFDVRLGPFSFLSFLRAELRYYLSAEKQQIPNQQTPFWRIGSNRIPEQTTS